MTKALTNLFDTLDMECSTTELNINDESAVCRDTQLQILRELGKMDADSVRLLLHRLSDNQLTQIVPIVDNIIDAFPSTEQTFTIISTTRDIFWLGAKLKLLSMAKK